MSPKKKVEKKSTEKKVDWKKYDELLTSGVDAEDAVRQAKV